MRYRCSGPTAALFLLIGMIAPVASLAPVSQADEPAADTASPAAADPIPVEADRGLLSLNTSYRYDPVSRQLWPIPEASMKVGCVYMTYAGDLQSWTWSQWMGDDGFRYAMGVGSIQPADNFHLTISEAEGRQVIEERYPELARKLEIQGASAVLRLDEDGSWRLNPNSCGARVFDERTGQRWEWHGSRQLGVVHLGGNGWRYENNRYVPAFR